MFRKPFILFSIFFAYSWVNAQTPFQQGIYWFQHRTDGAVGITPKPEPIQKAISYLEQAMNSGANKHDAGVYLMRCYIFKGRFLSATDAAKKDMFGRARVLGELLLQSNPNSPELIYEQIIAFGLWGDIVGPMKAGTDGILGKMKGLTDKLISLDPGFEAAAGYRIRGILHYRAPHIPVILTWPDKYEGLKDLGKALAKDPTDFGNVYYYAECLYDCGKKEEAKKFLGKVLDLVPRPRLLIEDRIFMRDAKKLLNEWE